MNDEWNNETTAMSVLGIAIAILGAILAIAIVVASLATDAHAARLTPQPSPPAIPEAGGGWPAAVLLEPPVENEPLSEEGWETAAAVIVLVLVVLGIKQCIEKRSGR